MNKKVLFVTYENPFTNDSGDRIYSNNILNGLFKLTKHVDIIYFDSNPTESKINSLDQQKFQRTELVKFQRKNSIKFIFSLLPGMIVNRKSKEYLYILKNLMLRESYDTILINHQKMMFTIPCIMKYKGAAKLVYTSHNVEYLLSTNLVRHNSSLIKKIMYWQDSIKTKWYEKKWISFFDSVTAISEHDADYFKKFYKASNVEIIRPVIEFNPEDKDEDSKKEINNIIIAGSFEWRPKRDNLLLLLNAKNFHQLTDHGITTTIVGRADTEFVNLVNKNYKGIHMTGEVASLYPYYQKAKIAIVPERLGGGFKLKVVEAALFKTAIFAIKGAITKCNFIKDLQFIEKESFEELISEIIKFQNEPEKLNNLIENAHSLAKKEYTIDKLMNTLKKVI